MRFLCFSFFIFLCFSRALALQPPIHTFSIVAFDPKTGDLGVAVESKYFGVGSVVPWAKAGVGAVATQALGKMRYGIDGLVLMEQGKSAPATLAELLAKDERREARQVGMIDAKGRVVAHTGAECIAWAGHHVGENFTVQGNLLAGEDVVKAMAETFEKARASGEGELAEWLMRARSKPARLPVVIDADSKAPRYSSSARAAAPAATTTATSTCAWRITRRRSRNSRGCSRCTALSIGADR